MPLGDALGGEAVPDPVRVPETAGLQLTETVSVGEEEREGVGVRVEDSVREPVGGDRDTVTLGERLPDTLPDQVQVKVKDPETGRVAVRVSDALEVGLMVVAVGDVVPDGEWLPVPVVLEVAVDDWLFESLGEGLEDARDTVGDDPDSVKEVEKVAEAFSVPERLGEDVGEAVRDGEGAVEERDPEV